MRGLRRSLRGISNTAHSVSSVRRALRRFDGRLMLPRFFRGNYLMTIRIGQGIDVHPFEDGRPLIIGGVTIPAQRGLAGHSDADVLLHAITDAVLGALGWGDIGQLFPNTDERFRGKDSRYFVREVWARASGEGWQLINCDCTILAEVPKIMPHAEKMRAVISGLFGVSEQQVSIKATTTERLGFVGREEGIVATAVVLLEKSL